jgi:tetratricopeptide (TPR) repeat protein
MISAIALPTHPRDMDRNKAVESAHTLDDAGFAGRAEIYWRDIVNRSLDDPEAQFALAARLCSNGRFVNALVYACHAIDAGVDDTQAIELIWRILTGLAGETAETGGKTTEQFADETVGLLKVDDEGVLWPSAYTTIVRLLTRLGVDESQLRSERGTDTFLSSDALLSPDTLLTRFRESRGEGVMPETIDNAIDRLASSEADAEAWFVLGRDSMGRDETETAQELFRRAAYLEPGRVKYRINLARALIANAQYADAYQTYLSVASLTADSRADRFHQEEATANRRSLLSRLILMVRKAIAEDDDAKAWATFRLIEWEDELPDRDGMRSAILRLSIDRVMKTHKAADPDTIRLARLHLERDPESIYVRQVLGQALMVAERFREAAEIWGSLTVSLPDNARMLLQYAKCLERSGAGEAAHEAAERALHMDPELESARIIRDRLAT